MTKNYAILFLLFFSFISVFSQVQVGQGTVVNEELPIEPYYGYTYSQVIYTAAEINSSGDISGISYTATAETTLESCSDWTVYMAHTTNSSFTDGDSWEPYENLTQMFAGTVSISDGVVAIDFENPFSYNGSDNLVVAVDQNQEGYDASSHDFYCSTTTDIRALTYYNDGTNPDPSAPPTGQIRNSIANVILNGITQSCANPTLSLDGLTNNSATVSWTATDVSSFEYVLQEAETGEPTEAGTITSENSVVFSDLTEGSAYEIYVRAVCDDIYSGWMTLTFTPPPTGSTGDNPIIIESIPYNTSDDTINYGDDYSNTATGCESGNGYYLNGDDVVYLYTATSTMSLNVSLNPSVGEGQTSPNYAGMYVYANEEDIGVNCWITELELAGSSELASFELSVVEGSTYYFVVSTWAAPQNVAYDLSITELLCGTPTNLAVSNVTAVSADISWDANEAVSWEYVSSTVEDSSLPTEAGTSISDPSVSIADCYPITGYDVWVRAVCEDGSTSDWTSITFTTSLQSPECGESISQYDYPNGSGGGSAFETNFDISNDYSSELLFTTTSGDQDSDGYTDEITVTISGSTETNYDWVFVTNGAGELLYGPVSGAQDAAVTSADGTINVYLSADTSVQGGPITFDVSCAGLSVNNFDLSNLKIYPNPVNGDYVTIQSQISGVKNVEVFDITGKRLINTVLESDTLNISSINAGIYLVKVTIQGQSKVSKLVIR